MVNKILLLILPILAVTSFESKVFSRRQAFVSLASGSVAVTLGSSNNGIPPAEAVLRSKGCYQGEGEGCSELAEDNDLIRSLQEKSLANKDRNEKEARDAYYNKNYPDFFASIGKVMIKKPDGSYMLVTTAEATELQQAGKLTLESPMTKGGVSKDYTQKPILTLKE